MRPRDVDRRYAKSAAKWVWVSGPGYVFDEHGRTPRYLVPVADFDLEHWPSDNGWWTCSPKTRRGDIAVLYRSGAKNEAGRNPGRGPRDLCQVAIATSDARQLIGDPTAGEFADAYGCSFAVVAQFDPPIGLGELRADSDLTTWPALRRNFVQSTEALPDEVWSRLLALRPGGRSPAPPDRGLSPREREQLEQRLEDWLVTDAAALTTICGVDVGLVGRQALCDADHGGVMDVLVRPRRKRSSLIVIELKAALLERDAIAQAAGYVGWLRDRRVRDATAIVVGLEAHPQVPWVQSMLKPGVRVVHWDEVPGVPEDLREVLARA